MFKNICIVDIDALPRTLVLDDITDYIAKQILSLTALPLFVIKNQQLECLVAENFVIYDNYKKFEIKVKEGFYFYDGTVVTAEAYLRRFKKIILNKTNYNKLFLKDIFGMKEYKQGKISLNDIGIFVKNNKITFILSESNRYFLEILSCEAFSPLHNENTSISAGAYYILENTEKYIHCVKNHYFINNNNDLVIDNIIFKIFDNRYDALNAYENKNIHLTCNTMFPYELINSYKRRIDFNRKYSNVSMTIIKNRNIKNYIVNKTEFWDALKISINRKIIANKFFNCLSILDSYEIKNVFDENKKNTDYFYNYDLAKKKWGKICANNNIDKVKFSISYHDFYPNKEVLLLIKEQLFNDFGLIINFVKDDFYSNFSNADCCLRLNYPYINSNMALYWSYIYNIHLFYNTLVWKKYINCYIILKNKEIINFNDLDNILFYETTTVSLFCMQSLYLKSPNIEFSDFSSGFLWRYKQNVK